MKHFLVFFLLLTCVHLFSETIMTQQEKQLCYDLLRSENFDSTSVDFLKDWATDTDMKLPIVLDILNHPFHYPDFVKTLSDKIENDNYGELLSFYQELLQANEDKQIDYHNTYHTYFRDSVKEQKDIFKFVKMVFTDADLNWNLAWKELSGIEKDQLTYIAYTMWQESEDSLRYKDFYKSHHIDTSPGMNMEKMKPLLKKVNMTALLDAAAQVQAGFDILRTDLQDKKFHFSKTMKESSKWGNLIIGSTGDDTYSKKTAFILDPDGNDHYQQDINTDFNHPYYWILDINGNDEYSNPEICSLFRCFAGIGVHADLNGNDVYTGNDGMMSSFFGYQCHIDNAGNDTYRGGSYSLGAGTFGISILQDKTGDDFYSCTSNGEGFGGTMGIGMISDFEGHDMYYAGGDYMHAPLAPLDQRTTSQGFGFGVRPDLGGGIGIIYDGKGNDSYRGGVYAQGVAYWYALGILIDKEGNDTYDAVYYPQGSGIHLAAGFLFDGSGEDHYFSKHGPGEGAAHDFGVGFFIDRAGNDIYSVEGGYGLALTNSVAVFLDVSGDDRYERNNDSNFGFASEARDSGGLGMFLDTGGKDYYANTFCKDDSLWQRGSYGFGRDANLVIPEKTVMQEMAETEAAAVDSTASVPELFKIACEWEVGSAQKRVQVARELLLKHQEETAKYIYENAMNSKDGLVYRAIETFAEKSPELKKYFPQGLDNPDSLVIKNTISLIADLSDSTYIPQLSNFLQQKKYVTAVLSALGYLGTDECLDLLQQYMHSTNEKERITVARGFKYIKKPRAKELLHQMSNDPSFLVQAMVRLYDKKNP
ncbi:MAG TPA: HEAT repeat domain-containing protein [Candidatus Cloacimonadota bacterium]|nr:HEAT repeat domain-containing protein [Candidatus Cloacimonadota bacterium]HPT70808.1 HEAT repeat domain-containing protein [Candidatus Cloacimonadota bacterium]